MQHRQGHASLSSRVRNPDLNRTCCQLLSASSTVQFWPRHAAYLGRQSTSRDIRNVCQLAWARRRHMGLRWRLCAGTKCQILTTSISWPAEAEKAVTDDAHAEAGT